MKPNDKAIEVAAKSLFGDYNDAEKKWVEEALTAAYAAQFQSGDYARLVERLRAAHISNRVEWEAAEAIEMLLAKMNNKPKPSTDYAGLLERLRKDISDPNGKLMSDWDSWRKYIASGGDSSWPRDQFEGHLDAIAEIHNSAADAIEALLVEREWCALEADKRAKTVGNGNDEYSLACRHIAAAIRRGSGK